MPRFAANRTMMFTDRALLDRFDACPFLFAELDRLGHDGFIGCEYNPRAGMLAGLGWLAPYLRSPA